MLETLCDAVETDPRRFAKHRPLMLSRNSGCTSDAADAAGREGIRQRGGQRA